MRMQKSILIGSISFIGVLSVLVLFYSIHSNNKTTLTLEEISSISKNPPPFVEGSITIAPYDESVDSITLEEQVDIIASNSGAEIIVITTYEQAKLPAPKSIAIKVKRLIDSKKFNAEIQCFDINNITRIVLRGEIVDELFKL